MGRSQAHSIRGDLVKRSSSQLQTSSWKIVDFKILLSPDWSLMRVEILGKTQNGVPNNLMPFISQVAVGKREYLNVIWR